MGLTQQEAEGRGAAYITSTYNYSDTAYGAPIEDHDGFVKVLADHETEEILLLSHHRRRRRHSDPRSGQRYAVPRGSGRDTSVDLRALSSA